MPKFAPAPKTDLRAPTETDWNTLPLKQAETLLADLRVSCEFGSRILAHRIGQERPNAIERCVKCKQELPKRVEHGREIYSPVYVETRRNPKTGIWERLSICSQACYMSSVRSGALKAIGAVPQVAIPQVPKAHAT